MLLLGAALAAGCGEAPAPLQPPTASPRFARVMAAPLDEPRMTFGAAWGDVDGDGTPELFLANHFEFGAAQLLRRSTDGQWHDVLTEEFAEPRTQLRGDRHAATFWDWDGDGDQDLALSRGASFGFGTGGASWFVREPEGFVDRATELGLRNERARGRAISMFDLDGDGDLDALCAALEREGAPTTVFLHDRDGTPPFSPAGDGWQLPPAGNDYAQLTHIDGHGAAVWLHGHPPRLYAANASGLREVGPALGLPPCTAVFDSVWHDLDGDCRADLFVARRHYGSDVAVVSPDAVLFELHAPNGGQGIWLHTAPGELAVHVEGQLLPAESRPNAVRPRDVRIGAGRERPAATTFAVTAEAATATIGQAADGLWVRYDREREAWHVRAHWPIQYALRGALRSTLPITRVVPEGFDLRTVSARPLLMTWDGDRLRDRTAAAGLDLKLDATSVAAGDFDNDMDVDLYVVASRPAQNRPNLLLENLGGGHFHVHRGAAGAPGDGGGRGDTVAVADFDGDGFLDLCVTNGEGEGPLARGITQLYRGLPNGNHWLRVELIGRGTNRDAIGARVFVEAGGRRQFRLQDGGVRRATQDDKRLHFGLGPDRQVDAIEVHWPSGQVQRLPQQAADRTLRIEEPAPGG